MTRKTLFFIDDAGTQHHVPAYRVLDVKIDKNNQVIIALSGNEAYTVTSPPYAELVLAYNNLPDNTQAYI